MEKIKHAGILSQMQTYPELQKHLQKSFDEMLSYPEDFCVNEEELRELNKLKASEDDKAILYPHVLWEVFKANFFNNEAGRVVLTNMTPNELAVLIRSDLEEDSVALYSVKDAGNKKYHGFTFS